MLIVFFVNVCFVLIEEEKSIVKVLGSHFDVLAETQIILQVINIRL